MVIRAGQVADGTGGALFEADVAIAQGRIAAVGPEGLTIRTVAGRAGVSSATAYTYFSSRNHLFAELFHRKVLLEHPVEIDGTELMPIA